MFPKKCTLFGTGPVFPVSDVAASVDFYCQSLGFKLDFMMGEPADHGIREFEMRDLNGFRLRFGQCL